jgi:hypothetical protein
MNDEIQNCRRPAISAAKVLLNCERVAQSRGLTILGAVRSLARTRVNLQQERVL